MGCFNMVGFYSNLPIKVNDDIVYFICASYGKLDDNHVLRPNDVIEPVCLPIYGKYNDYGSIEDIVHDENVMAIEKAFEMKIENIIDVIYKNSFLKKKDGDDDYQFILNKLLKSQNINHKNSFSLCATMEHRKVYDKMATLFVGNKIWGQEKTYIEVITDKLNNVLDYIKNNNPSYKNIFNPYKTDYDITKIIEIHSKLLEAKIPQDEVIESLSKADKKQWKLYKSKENKIKLEYSDLMDELVQYTNMKEYYFDMIFYNIVKDIDYEKIKDDIIRFICFNHSLTLFCGKYITSSYGFQSIVDFTDEFKEMNEVYNDIINCLKI